MEARQACRLTVYGRVQGVGFRPAVGRLGAELGLEGFVRNAGGFVELVARGSEEAIERLVETIYALPQPVQVEGLERALLAEAEFESLYKAERALVSCEQTFFAVASLEQEEKSFVPSDLALCPSCERELLDRSNRRYGYPYISCAQCGPRYTILRRLPYDRKNTTMDVFRMCPECAKEYSEFGARRQHAETISCKHCGPQLFGYVKARALGSKLNCDEAAICEERIDSKEALAKAKELLLAEKLIVVKSVGGFNLVCLANSAKAVEELRRLKHRPTKPLAIMCSSLAEARRLCQVSAKEAELLTSAVRPIVLLTPKEEAEQELAEAIAASCAELGIMLPPMGLYVELCKVGPLVVTSCNFSGAPIIYKDEEAFAYYKEHSEVAGLFTYEREILRPADDSVVRSVRPCFGDEVCEVAQVLRRTRGYLPEPVSVSVDNDASYKAVLALGADMEPSFCLSKGRKAYVAQVPCKLEEESSEAEFLSRAKDWEELLGIEPKLIVTDLHPDYYATGLGEALAEDDALPLVKLQHHQAHALSVIAEHKLAGPYLAVCFDGTGYGTDDTVWGGEFLRCEGAEYRRVAHLKAESMLGGDGSMKQAWKSAMCYGAAIEELQPFLEEDKRYALVKAALLQGINTIKNSSLGRLFDAASFILGLASENTHQGHCAQRLEKAATKALKQGLEPLEMHFVASARGWWAKELWPVLAQARGLGEQGIARAALGFHRAVIELVVAVAKEQQLEQVVLCGGCFANRILLEGCYRELTALGFKVYFNQQVAPGDGGLALGQAYYGRLVQN